MCMCVYMCVRVENVIYTHFNAKGRDLFTYLFLVPVLFTFFCHDLTKTRV
jgi:hypothetical protein